MQTLPIFKKTALPGRKEGVSGSIVIPTVLAINKYLDEEKIENAIEFMKFVALKETQKRNIINKHIFSGIKELYDDEEVCSVIECDLIKNIYPFSFMSNDVKLFGDDSYHVKYRENIFDYLYNDKPLSEVLKIIDDITRIYTFSVKTNDTSAGLIIYIIFLIFMTCMFLSSIFIFLKKFKKRFKFLSKVFWIITTLGSMILMSSVITLYGNVTNVKCHLRVTLINIGLIFSICPSLLELITNFPRNKISLWIENNKYISLLIIMIFTVSLNGILAKSPYNIQSINVSNEKIFKKCIMNNIFGIIIYYMIQLYDIFIILILLFLIFMEWNIKEIRKDINILSTALFMDSLSLIILNIFDKIEFKNYIVYNVLLAINILIFSVFNHLFIYFIRVLPIFEKNNKYKDSRIALEKSNSDLNDSNKFLIEISSLNKVEYINTFDSTTNII